MEEYEQLDKAGRVRCSGGKVLAVLRVRKQRDKVIELQGELSALLERLANGSATDDSEPSS